MIVLLQSNFIIVIISHLFLQLISLGLATEANSYSLELLPQSISQYTLLLLKVFYANVTEAQGGGLRSILSPEDGIMLGSDVRVAFAQGNIAAVTRSGIPSLTSFILLGDHTEIQEYIYSASLIFI